MKISPTLRSLLSDSSNDETESEEVSNDEASVLDTSVRDLVKEVKGLQKQQWVAQGVAASVLILGGVIFHDMKEALGKAETSQAELIKTELISESNEKATLALGIRVDKNEDLERTSGLRIDRIEQDISALKPLKKQ